MCHIPFYEDCIVPFIRTCLQLVISRFSLKGIISHYERHLAFNNYSNRQIIIPFFLPPSLSPSLLSFLRSFSYSLIFPFIKLDCHILVAWTCNIFTYSICKLCDTSILVPSCSQLRNIHFLPMTKILNGQTDMETLHKN